MSDADTKRSFSRVRWSRVVRYRDANAQVFRSAPVIDISMGGMYVGTDTPLSLGTKVYLQFMVETGEIVAEGWATVVRFDAGTGMGLEFLNVDEKFIAFTQMIVAEELIQKRLQK
jgi:hypothetical protein